MKMLNDEIVLVDSNEVRRFSSYKKLVRLTTVFPRSIFMSEEWKDVQNFLDYTRDIKYHRYPNIFIKQSDKSEFTISPDTTVFLSRSSNRAFEYFMANRYNEHIKNKMTTVLINSLVKVDGFDETEARKIVDNLNNNKTIAYYFRVL